MAAALWRPQAEAELEAILYYIAKEDGRPATAVKIGDEIRQKMALCAESPEIGQRYPELPEGFLGCVYKRWMVVYRPSKKGIEVSNVVDTARDFGKLFDDN